MPIEFVRERLPIMRDVALDIIRKTPQIIPIPQVDAYKKIQDKLKDTITKQEDVEVKRKEDWRKVAPSPDEWRFESIPEPVDRLQRDAIAHAKDTEILTTAGKIVEEQGLDFGRALSAAEKISDTRDLHEGQKVSRFVSNVWDKTIGYAGNLVMEGVAGARYSAGKVYDKDDVARVSQGFTRLFGTEEEKKIYDLERERRDLNLEEPGDVKKAREIGEEIKRIDPKGEEIASAIFQWGDTPAIERWARAVEMAGKQKEINIIQRNYDEDRLLDVSARIETLNVINESHEEVINPLLNSLDEKEKRLEELEKNFLKEETIENYNAYMNYFEKEYTPAYQHYGSQFAKIREEWNQQVSNYQMSLEAAGIKYTREVDEDTGLLMVELDDPKFEKIIEDGYSVYELLKKRGISQRTLNFSIGTVRAAESLAKTTAVVSAIMATKGMVAPIIKKSYLGKATAKLLGTKGKIAGMGLKIMRAGLIGGVGSYTIASAGLDAWRDTRDPSFAFTQALAVGVGFAGGIMTASTIGRVLTPKANVSLEITKTNIRDISKQFGLPKKSLFLAHGEGTVKPIDPKTGRFIPGGRQKIINIGGFRFFAGSENEARKMLFGRIAMITKSPGSVKGGLRISPLSLKQVSKEEAKFILTGTGRIDYKMLVDPSSNQVFWHGKQVIHPHEVKAKILLKTVRNVKTGAIETRLELKNIKSPIIRDREFQILLKRLGVDERAFHKLFNQGYIDMSPQNPEYIYRFLNKRIVDLGLRPDEVTKGFGWMKTFGGKPTKVAIDGDQYTWGRIQGKPPKLDIGNVKRHLDSLFKRLPEIPGALKKELSGKTVNVLQNQQTQTLNPLDTEGMVRGTLDAQMQGVAQEVAARVRPPVKLPSAIPLVDNPYKQAYQTDSLSDIYREVMGRHQSFLNRTVGVLSFDHRVLEPSITLFEDVSREMGTLYTQLQYQRQVPEVAEKIKVRLDSLIKMMEKTDIKSLTESRLKTLMDLLPKERLIHLQKLFTEVASKLKIRQKSLLKELNKLLEMAMVPPVPPLPPPPNKGFPYFDFPRIRIPPRKASKVIDGQGYIALWLEGKRWLAISPVLNRNGAVYEGFTRTLRNPEIKRFRVRRIDYRRVSVFAGVEEPPNHLFKKVKHDKIGKVPMEEEWIQRKT